MFKGPDGNYMEEFMKVGAQVPLVNSMGQMVPGVVVGVGEDTVKMDLNSPMAGKTLNFTGEVISVREATEKELKEGLHGELVHSNCKGGCGCGCEGGNCDGGDCEGGDCGCGGCE